MSITIRNAAVKDAEDILRIYGYYVENTAVSFEYTTPTAEEMKRRIENILLKYPYIVALKNGKTVGYAYADSFHARQAYDHCCEVSIYVDRDERKNGIGRCLYEALEAQLAERGFENLYACIALPAECDEYLDTNSRDFHSHMGYTEVGLFNLCGKKFGRYYSMVYMEKRLKKDI